MRLSFYINLHDYLPPNISLEEYEKANMKNNNIGFLKVNQKMMVFSDMLKEYINDGITNSRFFDLKIQEFLFLINAYYTKSIISAFFKPIYNRDSLFTNNVFENLDKVKTAKELAEKLGYGLSGFEKKFKRVFKVSPYRWMQSQKAKQVYHEVCHGRRTFTKISTEMGFSSPAHFNDFCRIYFGKTPGKLRKENR
jgi:AraC-like DNA-binding protein